jgi:AmmeMemoRadiSam system protein A
MAHGYLGKPDLMLTSNQQFQLREIAKMSITHGLTEGKPLTLQLDDYDTDLRTRRATFVTLHKHGQLRGCIGTLEPLRPLAQDVAYNAYAAAFSDHRFSPVSANELEQLDIHISILASPEEVTFTSEDNLASQLRPGIDGLIMEEGNHRGTFLPSVWESVTDRHEFLNHLKQKSGLPGNYWSDTIRIQRYTVEEF